MDLNSPLPIEVERAFDEASRVMREYHSFIMTYNHDMNSDCPDEPLDEMADALDKARATLLYAFNRLKDPTVAHLSMLSGGIGKISVIQAMHLNGWTNIDGWHDMTVKELEEEMKERNNG